MSHPHLTLLSFPPFTEAVVRRCSVEKVFLEIVQNLQENACARVSFFNKVALATLLKKRLWYRSFPVNLAKFLRTRFLTEQLRWLLLLLANLFSGN